MNTATVLDLITARVAATTAVCDELREQIAELTSELSTAESNLADLLITLQTLANLPTAR